MPRSERSQHISRPRWGRRALAVAVVPVLAFSAACGSTTPDAAGTPSSPAPVATSSPATSSSAAQGGTSSPAPGTTAGTDGAGFDDATVASFQQVLDDTRATGGFPGVIALVSSPQGTWIGTSGTTGEGLDGTPTPNDHTRVGSLTKTMTATVILQLSEEGVLDLSDPIGKFVPGMPIGDTATIQQLAEMTSGIAPYTTSDVFQQQLFADPLKVWTPEELIAFEEGQPAEFAPGQGWQYSNTNYVLLGMVIEQITGQSIAEVFQERLFGPLGMTDTVFPGSSNAIADPHLRGLTEQGQDDGATADATDWNPSEAYTAGEVISTLADLEIWAHALFTGEGILKPETQQMRRDSINRTIPPNTATAGYGFGIGDMGGWWGHDGQIPGYTTAVMHNYDLDTTIIVLVNSDIPLPGEKGPEPAPAVQKALAQALPGA
jgi:D-alanyl-D-alanine carboxypeptidase